LLIITKSLLQCGKGNLQHKNKLFYYRTYIPALIVGEESLSKKSSFTDFFASSFNSANKKVFIIFLCDINYKKKNIDLLTKKIYEILDEGAFEKQDLKKESTRRINFLYEQYQNLSQNSDRYIQLSDININEVIKSSNTNNDIIINDENFSYNNNKSKKESLIDISENDNIINPVNNLDESSKRNNSRIIWSKINTKSKSQIGSIDINDLTTIKESDSDLSIIFKQSLDENLNFSQMKKMKSIKKVNIVLCSVLFVISLVLIILLFIYS
jgi:nitrate/nitrite-specific signal transduction histidine kinase